MEYFGLFAFIMAIGLYSKVHRLERILRDNGIRPGGTAGLGEQVRKQVGRTVELTLETSDGDIMGKQCKVLDADDDERTLEDTVARALAQIEEKQYEAELLASGILRENIRKYGFGFQGKRCLIG